MTFFISNRDTQFNFGKESVNNNSNLLKKRLINYLPSIPKGIVKNDIPDKFY